MYHQLGGMDAAVSSAGSCGGDWCMHQGRDRFVQFGLNGISILLYLPASVVGAFVGYVEKVAQLE